MGLIYVYEYDLDEFDEFRNGLIADYNLKDVQQVTWIKPRNPLSKPIILTFKEKQAPEYIEIAGEQAKTKIYEYISSPMVCQGCLDFGQTRKNCKRDLIICGRCKETDHTSHNCTSNTIECHHCGDDHPTKSSKCSIYRYEKEIRIIQVRQRVSRQQAKVTFDVQNKNFMMNFANTAKASSETQKQPQDTVKVKR